MLFRRGNKIVRGRSRLRKKPRLRIRGLRMRYGEGQKRCLEDQENEYKSATDPGGEVASTYRMGQRLGIMEVPKNQWG